MNNPTPNPSKTPDNLISRRECEELRKSCVIFKGRKNHYGYGQIFSKYQNHQAHRMAYAIYHGKIGPNKAVLHKCDNPPCVNPLHLYLGTNSDNSKDSWRRKRTHNSKKTHCPKGHPYFGDNLLIRYYATGNPEVAHRQCKACINGKAREKYREKMRGKK